MARGLVYLVTVVDWYSRRVLSWPRSNSLETDFCMEAVNEANALPLTHLTPFLRATLTELHTTDPEI